MLYAIVRHSAADRIFNAFQVHPITNFFHGRSFFIAFEGFQHKRRSDRVDMETAFSIQRITERAAAAIAAAFENVFSLAADNFLRQVGGIVFSVTFQHRFQDDAFRPVRDDLSGGHQLDAVLFELRLVASAVVAVAGKAVQLPDQNDVKQLALAVLNHLLKLGAVVRFGRNRPVDIVLDHRDTVLLGIGGAFANLAFDGFLALIVGGIAGVDDGGYIGGTSLYNKA